MAKAHTTRADRLASIERLYLKAPHLAFGQLKEYAQEHHQSDAFWYHRHVAHLKNGVGLEDL